MTFCVISLNCDLNFLQYFAIKLLKAQKCILVCRSRKLLITDVSSTLDVLYFHIKWISICLKCGRGYCARIIHIFVMSLWNRY